MIYSFENACFRDKDTGLYSEAYFMEIFYREWHRMIREHNALSVLVIDPHIDIKSASGLQSYVNLAQLLESSTKRKTDLVSRFHDSEFIIGLFDLSPDGTTTIIERILETIENQTDGAVPSAKNTFIGALNVYPTQHLDISKILSEAEGLATNPAMHQQSNQSQYALRTHEVH